MRSSGWPSRGGEQQGAVDVGVDGGQGSVGGEGRQVGETPRAGRRGVLPPVLPSQTTRSTLPDQRQKFCPIRLLLDRDRERVADAGEVDLLVGVGAPSQRRCRVRGRSSRVPFLALGNATFGHPRKLERARGCSGRSAWRCWRWPMRTRRCLGCEERTRAAPSARCALLRSAQRERRAHPRWRRLLWQRCQRRPLGAIVSFPADATIAEQATALLQLNVCGRRAVPAESPLVDADAVRMIVGRAMGGHATGTGGLLQPHRLAVGKLAGCGRAPRTALPATRGAAGGALRASPARDRDGALVAADGAHW